MTQNSQLLSPSEAVSRCSQAYQRVIEESLTPGFGQDDRLTKARRAYRQLMPFLTLETLHAYIACVTHAMIREIISSADAKILLYAAQLIYNTRPRESRPAGRPPKIPGIFYETLDQPSPTVNQKINTPSPLPRVAEPVFAAPKAAAPRAKTTPPPPVSAPEKGRGIQWRLD